MEQWKEINGYEGLYEVSDQGNVRNIRTGRILKPQKNNGGYLQVYLRHRWFRVHRLVATAFVQNPNGYDSVNHINENKEDNRAVNLEWMAIGDNVRYTNEKKVRCIETDTIYDSIKKAAEETGISSTSISGCCRGEREAVKGYHWEYVD